MNGTVDINISGVFEKAGKQLAYVSFRDGKRTAEGVIPDCVISKNNGFTDDEKASLERYMKDDLANLKRAASRVNVMTAFMKDTGEVK